MVGCAHVAQMVLVMTVVTVVKPVEQTSTYVVVTTVATVPVG